MKKGVFLAVTLIWTLMFGGVNAESDYVNDYTLIDCIQGDDAGGVAFDSSQPYQSLKAGIEKTISYINANAKTQSGAVFNIKVNCFADSVSNETINLDYLGASYNNELYIESLTDSATI